VAYYLDTSAAAKLVLAESGSAALIRWLRRQTDTIVSSDLLRTELIRATRRGAPGEAQQARSVLDTVTLISVTTSTFERAAQLDPIELRSLDALHLAAALELGDELAGIITYDERLAAAAADYGVTVIAPT
jgi:predicted nucleic acid-binding protein